MPKIGCWLSLRFLPFFLPISILKEAEKAKAALDGKRALGKKIVVDWARFDPASKKNVRQYMHVSNLVENISAHHMHLCCNLVSRPSLWHYELLISNGFVRAIICAHSEHYGEGLGMRLYTFAAIIIVDNLLAG